MLAMITGALSVVVDSDNLYDQLRAAVRIQVHKDFAANKINLGAAHSIKVTDGMGIPFSYTMKYNRPLTSERTPDGMVTSTNVGVTGGSVGGDLMIAGRTPTGMTFCWGPPHNRYQCKP